MYNRHIRHLVTELGNRLSDKEFLKKIGLSRRSMQQLFNKDHWEVIFGKAFPVTRRFSCAEILEFCREDMEKLANEPEEGWLSFTYKYSTHILYPDGDFSASAAPYAPSALYFLNVLQYFFDEERKVMPFDPYDDFQLLTEEEYANFERAGEYAHFIREFRKALREFDHATVFVDLFGGSGLRDTGTHRRRPLRCDGGGPGPL